MPKKPVKIGLKTFVIACSESKIPFDLVFNDNSMPKTENINTIDGMVYNVITRNIGSGVKREYSTLYTDNYFTTHWLMKKLESINIYFIGTVKANHVPPVVQQHLSFIQLKRIQNECSMKQQTKWLVPVFVSSMTRFTIQLSTTTICFAWLPIMCTMLILHLQRIVRYSQINTEKKLDQHLDTMPYDAFLFDVLDQYIESYNRHQTHPSWKVQIYMWAFPLMEVSPYNMYKSKHYNPINHWEFKLSIALSLLMSRKSCACNSNY